MCSRFWRTILLSCILFPARSSVRFVHSQLVLAAACAPYLSFVLCKWYCISCSIVPPADIGLLSLSPSLPSMLFFSLFLLLISFVFYHSVNWMCSSLSALLTCLALAPHFFSSPSFVRALVSSCRSLPYRFALFSLTLNLSRLLCQSLAHCYHFCLCFHSLSAPSVKVLWLSALIRFAHVLFSPHLPILSYSIFFC